MKDEFNAWVSAFEIEMNRRFGSGHRVSVYKHAINEIDLIADIVSEETGVPVDKMKSESREKETVNARQIVLYLCRLYTRYTNRTIGRCFNRDHTTVMHSFRTIANHIIADDGLVMSYLPTCESLVKQKLSTDDDKS
jgi:chromosomal replication initiation ATPase DnaA